MIPLRAGWWVARVRPSLAPCCLQTQKYNGPGNLAPGEGASSSPNARACVHTHTGVGRTTHSELAMVWEGLGGTGTVGTGNLHVLPDNLPHGTAWVRTRLSPPGQQLLPFLVSQCPAARAWRGSLVVSGNGYSRAGMSSLGRRHCLNTQQPQTWELSEPGTHWQALGGTGQGHGQAQGCLRQPPVSSTHGPYHPEASAHGCRKPTVETAKG